jgi:hypothetical protein
LRTVIQNLISYCQLLSIFILYINIVLINHVLPPKRTGILLMVDNICSHPGIWDIFPNLVIHEKPCPVHKPDITSYVVQISSPCCRLEGNLKDRFWNIGVLFENSFQILLLCGGVIIRETCGMEPTLAFPTKSLLLYIRVP